MYLGDDAYEKRVDGATVKVRDPWRVGLLAVVTVGVYSLVWFYKINRELNDFAKAREAPEVGGNPVLALVGMLLVVPAIPVWIWTLVRIRRAQDVEGADQRLTLQTTLLTALIGLVPVGGALVWHEHVQFHLNRLWGHRPGAAAVQSGAEPKTAPA